MKRMKEKLELEDTPAEKLLAAVVPHIDRTHIIDSDVDETTGLLPRVDSVPRASPRRLSIVPSRMGTKRAQKDTKQEKKGKQKNRNNSNVLDSSSDRSRLGTGCKGQGSLANLNNCNTVINAARNFADYETTIVRNSMMHNRLANYRNNTLDSSSIDFDELNVSIGCWER